MPNTLEGIRTTHSNAKNYLTSWQEANEHAEGKTLKTHLSDGHSEKHRNSLIVSALRLFRKPIKTRSDWIEKIIYIYLIKQNKTFNLTKHISPMHQLVSFESLLLYFFQNFKTQISRNLLNTKKKLTHVISQRKDNDSSLIKWIEWFCSKIVFETYATVWFQNAF